MPGAVVLLGFWPAAWATATVCRSAAGQDRTEGKTVGLSGRLASAAKRSMPSLEIGQPERRASTASPKSRAPRLRASGATLGAIGFANSAVPESERLLSSGSLSSFPALGPRLATTAARTTSAVAADWERIVGACVGTPNAP